MAEGSYEAACMRAELLGIEPPNYNDFLREQEAKRAVPEEDLEIDNLKEAEQQNEDLNNVSGGLDELTNILKATQGKINKFKQSCSSIANLLRIRPSTPSQTEQIPEETPQEIQQETSSQLPETPRKSELSRALDNQVDRLDLMIEKAENAEYSMKHQTRQMKTFLN